MYDIPLGFCIILLFCGHSPFPLIACGLCLSFCSFCFFHCIFEVSVYEILKFTFKLVLVPNARQ